MPKLHVGLLLISGFLLGQAVHAEQESFRQHGAHVHGIGQLNVALEGDRLWIEFISPAINIVGFEHPPGTHEQKQSVDNAIQTLKDPTQVFAFAPESDCRPTGVDVETTILKEEHHEHGDEHHAHEEGENHGHGEHDEETHSEFQATYEFQCAQPDRLEYIDVLLFERFAGTEEIEARIIGPHGQSSVELTPGSVRLRLGMP